MKSPYPISCGEKRCYKCGETKPRSKFNKNSARWDGVHSSCAACQKQRRMAIRRDPVLSVKHLEQARRQQSNRSKEDKLQASRRRLRRYSDGKVNPRQLNVNARLRTAVYSGKIIKPSTCQSCGCSGVIHGHHENYDRPYDVLWLCVRCHADVHRDFEFPRHTELGVALKQVAILGI